MLETLGVFFTWQPLRHVRYIKRACEETLLGLWACEGTVSLWWGLQLCRRLTTPPDTIPPAKERAGAGAGAKEWKAWCFRRGGNSHWLALVAIVSQVALIASNGRGTRSDSSWARGHTATHGVQSLANSQRRRNVETVRTSCMSEQSFIHRRSAKVRVTVKVMFAARYDAS